MKYFTTQRPVMPGTVPGGFVAFINFDERTYCPEIEREAWGIVEYAEPLTDKQVSDYELTPE